MADVGADVDRQIHKDPLLDRLGPLAFQGDGLHFEILPCVRTTAWAVIFVPAKPMRSRFWPA